MIGNGNVNVNDSNAFGSNGASSGNALTGFPSPTAEQPLLAPEEEDDSGPAGPGTGLPGGGGSGAGPVTLPPVVTVMSNSQQPAQAATSSHDQLVRRRSLDANSFRSAT